MIFKDVAANHDVIRDYEHRLPVSTEIRYKCGLKNETSKLRESN